jgi:hypothetical protein
MSLSLALRSGLKSNASERFERIEIEAHEFDRAVDFDSEYNAALANRTRKHFGTCGQRG